MAVGLPMKTTYANGDVYSAQDVNDITGTINQNVNPYTAGKNKIINGDFRIWQRGTSFNVSSSMTADRWRMNNTATTTVSQQTFTPGTAPVAGYEGQYFLQLDKAAGAGTYSELIQRIEDVRTFAGQTITISYWARVTSGTATNELYQFQAFGTGGSADVGGTISPTHTLTTSWQRFSVSVAIPSIAGKTIGTGSFFSISVLRLVTSSAVVAQIWGVQVEAGSTATAFQTATGTIQGELAACQRYYVRYSAGVNYYSIFAANSWSYSTTIGVGFFAFPVELRTSPISMDSSNLAFSKWDNVHYALSSPVLETNISSNKVAYVYATMSGGPTGGTVGYFGSNNSSSGYIGFSAEL